MSDGLVPVSELLQQIETARAGMSVKNPHRRLLEQCAVAITFLAQAVPEGQVMSKGGIILP